MLRGGLRVDMIQVNILEFGEHVYGNSVLNVDFIGMLIHGVAKPLVVSPINPTFFYHETSNFEEPLGLGT